MEHPPSSSPCSCLPKPSDLSDNQVRFLNEKFQTHQDLVHKAPPLHTSLRTHSSLLDSHLQHLKSTLSHLTVSWIRRSFSAKTNLHNLDISLQNLSLVTSQGSFPIWVFQSFNLYIYLLKISAFFCFFLFLKLGLFFFVGFGGIAGGSGWKKLQKVLGTELPQLAKEVKGIENIRSYLGELGISTSNLEIWCLLWVFNHLEHIIISLSAFRESYTSSQSTTNSG